MTAPKKGQEWSGSPADEALDAWWKDDETGEYIRAADGERMQAADARMVIAYPALVAALKGIIDERTGGTYGLPASHKDAMAAHELLCTLGEL